MIKKEDIQKVLDAANILEVIGEFVQLKKTGSNYKGLSPFNDEKTPSFVVSPAKKIFKDFSSGKGGSVINFLMEHEKFSYPEAIRFLAKKYNIELIETEISPDEIAQQNKNEALYNLNQFACNYFSDILFQSENKKAIGLTYFKERGFSEETIKNFGLGYCLDLWDGFTKHAIENGYKKEYLTHTGLAIEKDDNLFDRYRNRVMFPIHNLSGRILGFGGRTLSSEKNKAKYVNSPESDIYQKSKILYGLYFAKNAIVKEDVCYLVEGYTDFISLYQLGIQNLVSSSGTSLTTAQIKLIKRYTSNITILYDGDEAGIKASFRGIDMILQEGLNVRVVLFPEGKDPDSYIRDKQKEEVEKYIQSNTDDFILFKTKLLLKDIDNDPIKKTDSIKEFIQTIALIPDGLTRREYIKEIWEILGVSEATLNYEVNKIIRQNFIKQQKPEAQTPEIVSTDEEQLTYSIDTIDVHEKELIKWLMLYGNYTITSENKSEDNKIDFIKEKISNFIIRQITEDELKFSKNLYQKIFDIYVESEKQGNELIDQFFINHDDDEIVSLAIDIFSSPYILSENWHKRHNIYIDTPEDSISLRTSIINIVILSFKWHKLKLKVSQISKELNNINNLDNDEARIIMHQHIRYTQVLNIIAKKRGRIIN